MEFWHDEKPDGTLNYRRFGYWKTETEPSDGFPQIPRQKSAVTTNMYITMVHAKLYIENRILHKGMVSALMRLVA